MGLDAILKRLEQEQYNEHSLNHLSNQNNMLEPLPTDQLMPKLAISEI